MLSMLQEASAGRERRSAGAWRSSSARFQSFSASLSCSRLRRVQALLNYSNKQKSDGILCILGIDSRYNEGCRELANYLLFDLYNLTNIDSDVTDLPEEVLDDVIILIKSESVHLYCNPINYNYLLPYVAYWKNLHLHCLTVKEYEDEELAEEFKITSFVNMVQDCCRIQVPYSFQGHVRTFDMFIVEKWPIVQAFALEGIGGGEFFTMKHEMFDASEELWQVYSSLDPVSLEVLITEDLVAFKKQWDSFFSNFDIENSSTLLELSEAQSGEPFRTYFSHGLITSQIADKSSLFSTHRQPFVLFGCHSTKENLNSYSFAFPSEGHLVKNTNNRGGTAKHMVVQCSSPRGPLACSRTYFFGNTHVPYTSKDNNQQINDEFLVLPQIYIAVVEAVLASIRCYVETPSIKIVKEIAEDVFLSTLDCYGLGHYKAILSSKLCFLIEAVNSQGTIVSLESHSSKFLIKTASMTVYDIPDLTGGKGTLGSIVFSESFLESKIFLKEKDGAMSTDSNYMILSAIVPRYVSWMVEDAEVKLSEEVQQILKMKEHFLGTLLIGGASAYLYSGSSVARPEEGKLLIFSEGILFIHPRSGSMTISKNHMTALKYYDGNSPGVVGVLIIEYKKSLLPHLPIHLHSTSNCLMFALMPGLRLYKSFYSQVMPTWQKMGKSGIALKICQRDQLSEEQKQLHCDLEKVFEVQSRARNEERSRLKQFSADIPGLDVFVQHFAVSSMTHEPVRRSDLPILLQQPSSFSSESDDQNKMVITIVAGLPGSYKEELCTYIVNLTQEHGRWSVYRQMLDNCEPFNYGQIHHFLSSVLEAQRNRTVRQSVYSRRKVRLLIVTPGYTDVIDVVQAIQMHPDPEVQSAFVIGAVTTCIDPQCSTMEHRLLFPKLLDQCSQGVVSNVVFTSLTSEQRHPILVHLQKLIRVANPKTAFILAEKGAVTRNADIEMILSGSSFSEPFMLKTRYLMFPGWWNGKFRSGPIFPQMTQICIRFSCSLDKARFVTKCKALKNALKSSPFFGNTYHIRAQLKFSDSEKRFEICHNVQANIFTAHPLEDGPSPPPLQGDGRLNRKPLDSFVVFIGCMLKEETMKDWLRQCARQKLMKKPIKTFETLTKQEIKNIHTKRHLDLPPPGWFYNGNQFVNFFGEKSDYHPLMDTFIEEYLLEVNKDIEKHNAEVEKQESQDLFEP
ncbi:dynein axonemal assembly factor 9 isoform X2 [Rhinoraja longicauda]